MLQKRTYLHYQTPRGKSLGFTAAFTPLFADTDCSVPLLNDRGDMLCAYNITICNRKDKHFNKRIAREVLETRETTVVRVRDLPVLLADAATRSVGSGSWFADPDDFNFILKRFV